MSDDERIPYSPVVADALFSAYENRLVRFMISRRLDYDTAEDVAQETWLELFKTWQRDGTLELPVAKLFMTARWKVADHFRRTGRKPVDLVANMAADDEDTAKALMTMPDFGGLFTSLDVVNALRTLPARQREVLVWRIGLDLPVKITAALMVIEEHHVKNAQLRALKKLRDSPFLSGYRAKSAQPEVTK